MPKQRLVSYVGFALKSNSVVFGLDNLKKSYKKVFGVLIDTFASENTKNQVKYFCETRKIDLKEIKNLDEIFGTINCKVVGLTNKELSKQILECED